MKGTTVFSVLHIHTLLTPNTHSNSGSSRCIHDIHHPLFHSLKAKTNSTARCSSCRCVFCSPPRRARSHSGGGRGPAEVLPSNSHRQVPGPWRDDTAQNFTGLRLIPGFRSALGRGKKEKRKKRGVAEFGGLTGILDHDPP